MFHVKHLCKGYDSTDFYFKHSTYTAYGQG